MSRAIYIGAVAVLAATNFLRSIEINAAVPPESAASRHIAFGDGPLFQPLPVSRFESPLFLTGAFGTVLNFLRRQDLYA